MKIKRGDTILVIAGKNRNKTGKVTKVIKEKDRIAVEGINIAKKHIKPNRTSPQGGIIDITRPIPVSNAMVICPHCSKATRIGCKITEKGKLRVCKHCDAALDQE